MIELIINADDLGMSQSINEAIFSLSKEGLVSQASIMAVTPNFKEAYNGAIENNLPTGVHLTLASEWDITRWRPLTSIGIPDSIDNSFPYHVRDLVGRVDDNQVFEELKRQIVRVKESGINPTHIDSHIIPFSPQVLEKLCSENKIYTRDQSLSSWTYPLASIFCPTPLSSEEKLSSTIAYLTSLKEGVHMIICHPSLDDSKTQNMCSPKMGERYKWAGDYRRSDYELLRNPKIRNIMEEKGIQVTSFFKTQPLK